MPLPSESLEQMQADADWQPWADQGWTLHQMRAGGVQAVNLTKRMATRGVKNFEPLLRQLTAGHFTYVYFVAFKKQVERDNRK